MDADTKITLKHHTALLTGNIRKFWNEQINQSWSSVSESESIADRKTFKMKEETSDTPSRIF